MISSTPFCSVIIPALNEEKDIAACLTSLSQQTYPRDCYEIIIVDNGSTDSTKSIASKYADLVLEKTSCNVGAARNYGVEMAKGEILICTDSDCIVDNNWIENGVALISNNENTIFGGGLKPRTNPSWIERLWLLNDNGETVQQNDLMGSCIFTSRQLYLKSGKFPEDITSGEDTFFSRAAKHEGINVVLSPSLSLAHLGSPTTPVDFIKRQRWHGENYLKNPKESIKDKTFLIALCYSTSLIISFSSVVLNFWTLLFFSAATATACAGIVSAKRVKRARDMRFKLRDTFGILVLDHFYLTGRSLGILTGLIHKTMKYIAYDS